MSLKKKLKKVGKAAAVAGAAYLASKAMAGKGSSKFLSSGAAGGARLPKGDSMARAKKLLTSNSAYKGVTVPKVKPNKSIMSKIGAATSKFAKNAGAATKKVITENVNLGRGPNIKKTDSLASPVLSGNVFGLGDMDGAKAGGMMYAKNGTYVKAKCKLGRNKKTLIT